MKAYSKDGIFSMLTFATALASPAPLYKHDPSWQPPFLTWPSHLFSAVAVIGDEVFVSQRGNYSQPIVVLDRTGKVLRGFGSDVIGITPWPQREHTHTWGGHGLAAQYADPQNGPDEDRVWVCDCKLSKVHVFAPNGTHLKSAGRPGYGASEFGCVSDATFHGGNVYLADGDATKDNRVEAWTAASGVPGSPLWTSEPAGKKTDGKGLDHLSWPHSITWHEGLGKLLVADRGGPNSPVHSRIVVMDPATGHIEKTLTCAGLETPKGYPAPFGVRSLRTKDEDLLFVAVGDLIPQDGNPKNQWIYIIDASKLAVDGTCETLQRINFSHDDVASDTCDTPHLLGIDYKTYDVYMACVSNSNSEKAKRSNVIRITRVTGQDELTSDSGASALIV